MTAATVPLASSSSSAINHDAASPSVGDGPTPPVSGLAEDSGFGLTEDPGSELAEGSGEIVRLGVGVGVGVEVGEGVGVGVGVGAAAVTTATLLQVEPQPVAAEDRVTEVRLLFIRNTSPPSVGASPKKVTEVSALKANASKPMDATEAGIISVSMMLL
jgi:hypothetical protein